MKRIDIDDAMLHNFYKTISENIVRIRKERGISQLDLATSIGHTSATFVGKAELLTEGKHFNLEHLYKMALVLNIEIEDFFKNIKTKTTS